MKAFTKKHFPLKALIFCGVVALFGIGALSKTLNDAPLLEETVAIASPGLSAGFSSIASSALRAVTNISTTQSGINLQDPYGPQLSSHKIAFDELDEIPSEFDEPSKSFPKEHSAGSGFIIISDETSALIVTNYHVVANADKILISLNDHTELDATILGIDSYADLAVLKVTTKHLPKDRQKLETLEWGDSEAAKVGDFVLAIGNSFGMGSSVTYGIISSLSRQMTSPQMREYPIEFIQHCAPINRGNSGGPLLNLEGKVIGINTAIFSPTGDSVGIGFCISSARAKERINQLIDHGRIRKGWLGIKTQRISGEALDDSSLEKEKSYKIVGSVTPFGPAAKAQIKSGDLILEFDGKEVTESTNFSQLINETPAGKTVKIKLYRLGQIINVEATLEENEEKSLPRGHFESPSKLNLTST